MDRKIRVLKSRSDTVKKTEKSNASVSDLETVFGNANSGDHFNEHDIYDNEHNHKRVLGRKRIVIVVCTLVFTMLASILVGAELALWDVEKPPSYLKAAITGYGLSSGGQDGGDDTSLTFIDASGDTETSDSGEDTGLKFIDADDTGDSQSETDASDEAVESDEAGNSDSSSETVSDTGSEDTETATAGTDAESAGELDTNTDAVTETADGTIVVSSELAGVSNIVKAGTDQVLTAVASAQTSAVDPNEGFPLPFTAVDDSYFDDALFIGDSRFYGFMLWSGISGTNYCATSFNIFQYETFKVVQTGNGKVPIFSALPYNAFTKIYIKVGLNEMGSSEEKFEAKYAELIEKLRQMEPRAIIYVHAVLPVTAAKSASDSTHNNPNIIARNASLKQFAQDHQCYYLDAGPVLSDDSGCLKAEMTGDGIHLSSRYMGVWKQYLMENAVVVDN